MGRGGRCGEGSGRRRGRSRRGKEEKVMGRLFTVSSGLIRGKPFIFDDVKSA